MKLLALLVLVPLLFCGCYGGAWNGRHFFYPEFVNGFKVGADNPGPADYWVYAQSTSVRPVKNDYIYQIDVNFYRQNDLYKSYAKFRRYIVAKQGPIDIEGKISKNSFRLEINDRNETEEWGIDFKIGPAPEYLPEIVTQEGNFRR